MASATTNQQSAAPSSSSVAQAVAAGSIPSSVRPIAHQHGSGVNGSLAAAAGNGDTAILPSKCSRCCREIAVSSRGSDRIVACDKSAVGDVASDACNLCTRCCFRLMDPFRPVLEDEHVLEIIPVTRPMLSFSLELPDLRQWRKEGYSVELRMLRKENRGNLRQAWPRILSLEVNGNVALAVKPPLRGKKRRDVPKDISAALRRGKNEVELRAEDQCRDDFILGLVRTRPQLSRVVPPMRVAVTRRRVGRPRPPPPRHAIAVDSDAPPEDVTDSDVDAGCKGKQ